MKIVKNSHHSTAARSQAVGPVDAESRRRLTAPVAAGFMLISAALTATAAEPTAADKQALIDEALSAAPPQIAATATVTDMEGNVLRAGNGNFTCTVTPLGAMCNDPTFATWMQAVMQQQTPEISAIGISYMLAGDPPDGGASNIDPGAQAPTADNQWVVEGPHVMIAVPDRSLLSVLPSTPDTEGPYVMWPDTPYAHIMLPVDARPQQRPVTGQ